MQKRHALCIRRTSTGFFLPCLCFFSALWACYLCAASSANAFPKEEEMDLRGYLQGEGANGLPIEDFCADQRVIPTRAKRVSISDFKGIGDGKFLNTRAIGDAIAYLESFGYGGGGSELHIPAGTWLTGRFNVTSHFTLFLDEGAVLLGSQDPKHWPVIDPLPSYGTGRELPGGRHISLIHGENLTDVVITGNNGTVDGQGEIWWRLHFEGKLDFTRGHLLELMHSRGIVISNLTFKNSPFWNIHPVYCSNVLIQNLTILAPIQSPNTDGIDPDSIKILGFTDLYSGHPDSRYDPSALPSIANISISDVVGTNVSVAGDFRGLPESPFRDVFLRNITLDDVSARAPDAWRCSFVHGYSRAVRPLPCPSLCQSFA